MSNAEDKARKVLRGAAALGAAITVDVNAEHGEVDRVAVLGVPLFLRDQGTGRPRILGVPFPRWIRGPRQ